MSVHSSALIFRTLFVMSLLGGLSALPGERVRLEAGALRKGEEKFVIRGVGYQNPWNGGSPGHVMSSRACLYARDLPLIAAMGANTVRTYGLLSEQDSTFLPVLETAGLYWLADFPLDPFYDPSQPILAKKEQILEAFRHYAELFRDNPRVIGYVFGNEVARDYNRKFAGAPSEFYSLIEEAAAILAEVGPLETTLLTTAVGDVDELRSDLPGLSFWAWNAHPAAGFRGQIELAREKVGVPVLIAGFDLEAYDRLGAKLDDLGRAEAAAGLAADIQAAGDLLGGIYNGFPDLFRAMATTQPGLDSLQPRATFYSLAKLWGGRIPPSWSLPQLPRLEKIEHAASGVNFASPGALVRITGSALGEIHDSPANPWALHDGTVCLCFGDDPAPIVSRSPEVLIAQVPWNANPGERAAVLFRAGTASSVSKARIERFAPGIFPGAVLRAGTGCPVSIGNGLRPGELLEIYGTGLGWGSPPAPLPEAFINQTPAEILYAGLLPAFVGLNQVNLRVAPLTPASRLANLELRMDGISSNPYPLSVLGPADKPAISLNSPDGEIVLQAGAPGVTVQVGVEGKDGYCGPVLFTAGSLPDGISFRVPVAFTGQTVPLEVRAASGAKAIDNSSLILFGYAGGASSGQLVIRLAVLPNRGNIPVRVVSGGYKSAPMARFDWNGRAVFVTAGGGPGRGINVLAVNPESGVFSSAQSFDTWGDVTASQRLTQYLSGLPAGTIALFAAADDGSLLLSQDARDAIAGMFGSRSIRALDYQQSWALIGRKGLSTPIGEGISATAQVVLERVLTLPAP
jgi:uncharacterized protein (TIGR03437 family)